MLRTFSQAILLALSAACATTGATYKSGVGDKMLSRAPYYAGAASTPVAAAGVRVGALPVAYQPRPDVNAIFDPAGGEGSAVEALLADMNAYLDSVTAFNGAVPVRVASLAAAGGSASVGVPPDVRFGCLTEGDFPGEDCIARGDSVLGRDQNLNQLKLSVGRPSADWTTWAATAMDEAEVAYVLVLTVEVGQYWLRQSGLAARKSVELGTNHAVSQPWLTSLETPVTVLQLTGALVDRSGKALRIGAEGMLPKRTPLLASSFGLEALITDDDIAQLRTARRDDLPGRPLVWQEALRQLVHGLTR